MASAKPGAALVMAIPAARLSTDLIEGVIGCLLNPELIDQPTADAWRNPDWRAKRMEALVGRKTHQPIDVYWEPPRPGPINMGMMLTYHLDAMNRDQLQADDWQILRTWVYDVQLQGENASKFVIPLQKFREILGLVKPPFALIDHYSAQIQKRRKEDLRRRAWGVTVYGPEMRKVIGSERLAVVPAYKVETLSWGGMWIQLNENPFAADSKRRQAMERHLGLSERLESSKSSSVKVR